MVVVEHSEYPVKNRMVELPYPDVDAENSMDDIENETVDHVAYCRSYSPLVVEAIESAVGGLGLCLLLRSGREIRLQHPFSFTRRKWSAKFIAIGVEGPCLARAHHCRIWKVLSVKGWE